MISELYPYAVHGAYCEHCKKKCDTPEHYPFMVKSSNGKPGVILCNACIDMALFEGGILPEDF